MLAHCPYLVTCPDITFTLFMCHGDRWFADACFLSKFGETFVALVGQVKFVVLPNLGAQISSGDHKTKQNFDRFYPTSTLPLSFSTFQ